MGISGALEPGAGTLAPGAGTFAAADSPTGLFATRLAMAFVESGR